MLTCVKMCKALGVRVACSEIHTVYSRPSLALGDRVRTEVQSARSIDDNSGAAFLYINNTHACLTLTPSCSFDLRPRETKQLVS